MNAIADIFTADQLHRGFGKFDDLGVGFNYDLYDINIAKANKDQKQPCNHCGKGLNLDTCYLALYAYNSQAFIAIDVDHDALMNFKHESRWSNAQTGETRIEESLSWTWVFLGSECAKNIPDAFRILYKDFFASKWYGTPAHHNSEWGTW